MVSVRSRAVRCRFVSALCLFARVLRRISLCLFARSSLAKHEQKFCFFLAVLFGFASWLGLRSAVRIVFAPLLRSAVPFLANRPSLALFLCCVFFAPSSPRGCSVPLSNGTTLCGLARVGSLFFVCLFPASVIAFSRSAFPCRPVLTALGFVLCFLFCFRRSPCSLSSLRPLCPRVSPAPPSAFFFVRFRLVGASLLDSASRGREARRSWAKEEHRHKGGVASTMNILTKKRGLC